MKLTAPGYNPYNPHASAPSYKSSQSDNGYSYQQASHVSPPSRTHSPQPQAPVTYAVQSQQSRPNGFSQQHASTSHSNGGVGAQSSHSTFSNGPGTTSITQYPGGISAQSSHSSFGGSPGGISAQSSRSSFSNGPGTTSITQYPGGISAQSSHSSFGGNPSGTAVFASQSSFGRPGGQQQTFASQGSFASPENTYLPPY